MSLIGEILIAQGKLQGAARDRALELQKLRGAPLGMILVAENFISLEDLDRALAHQLGLPHVEVLDDRIDLSHLSSELADHCIKELVIPLESGEIYIADPDRQKLARLRSLFGEKSQFTVTGRFQILYHLHLGLRDKLSKLSVFALAESYPNYSAGKVFIGRQLFFLYSFFSASLIWLFVSPWGFLLALNILVTVFLVVSFFFKFLLAWKGSHGMVDTKIAEADLREVKDADLPTYTILVPMYKEPEVLPIIVRSISELDYPKEKLDVKFVLEEDDEVTLARARELNLHRRHEVVIVPASLPKTKPKATNYGLQFARGEMLTIYDAEDRPEPDQLKKAVAAFRKGPENLAVVQARLNFFNADENWLTRMFTLEYSLWFDFYLPALERLQVPIPLGGTSNHFRTSVLRAVGGWDPFNVTEDADLGIRFSQFGYCVGVVNSTTFEEANTHYGNWIRQRSRWIKGYLQTYLVHMRSPFDLYRKIGFRAFFSFQFFIGGTFLTALVTPVLYGVFFIWLMTRTGAFDPMFVEPLLYVSLLNLLLGNAFFIYILMIGVFKRGYYNLIPYALTTPVYWLMLSQAALKGLWQLFTNPFYWEKTQHGLSKMTKELAGES